MGRNVDMYWWELVVAVVVAAGVRSLRMPARAKLRYIVDVEVEGGLPGWVGLWMGDLTLEQFWSRSLEATKDQTCSTSGTYSLPPTFKEPDMHCPINPVAFPTFPTVPTPTYTTPLATSTTTTVLTPQPNPPTNNNHHHRHRNSQPGSTLKIDRPAKLWKNTVVISRWMPRMAC